MENSEANETELKTTESLNELDNLKGELEVANDKYIRLAAEFENFKRRVQKEKEELVTSTKVKTLTALLDMDNDFNHAKKAIKNPDVIDGINVIHSKLSRFLSSQGIDEIQVEEYDEDLHEVISIVPGDTTKIIDVVSKGYTLNGKPFRYPKIVLQKND